MIKNILSPILAIAFVASLAGCSTTPKQVDILGGRNTDEQVQRKAMVVALISAGGKTCGLQGTDQYRTAFIHGLRLKRVILPELDTKIHQWFEAADVVMKKKYTTAAARAEFCERGLADQETIDRGIHGDFTLTSSR